jgi:hypothetical protein
MRINARTAGAVIPDSQPLGLCPRCALKGALDLSAGGVSGFEYRVSGLPRAFGDYELLEEIARGGMGIVFLEHKLGEWLESVGKLEMLSVAKAPAQTLQNLNSNSVKIWVANSVLHQFEQKDGRGFDFWVRDLRQIGGTKHRQHLAHNGCRRSKDSLFTEA